MRLTGFIFGGGHVVLGLGLQPIKKQIRAHVAHENIIIK